MLRPALLVPLLAAACGGPPSVSITATAVVDGSFVVITATCTQSNVRVEAAGQEAACEAGKPAILKLPVQPLGGAGPKKIPVTARGPGKPTTVEVAIDIPATAMGPYFSVDKCTNDTGADNHFIGIDTGGGRKLECSTAGGARIKLAMQANPRGKLVLGGNTMEVPESGKLDIAIELTDGMLALTLDDLVDNSGDGPVIAVPWKLEAAGKPLEGKLGVSVKFGNFRRVADAWLRDLTNGKLGKVAFAPHTGGPKTAVLVPPDKFSALRVTDRRGTLRDVDVIAVEREGTRTKAGGTCDFDSRGKVVRATRFALDIEIKAFGTAEGKVIATKTFPAPAGCPSFAMLHPSKPEVAVRVAKEDVDKWLETLIAEGAPTEAAPTEAAAPAAQ